jgi:2-dehydropantoate 2-reductase
MFVDVDHEHIAAIRKNGLRVDVPDGSFNVKINIGYPNEIQGQFDIGFIAVRSNYTPQALDSIVPHLANNGLLVSMQNGINPPLLEDRVGPDRAVGMAIRMGCRKVAPGHVHTAIRGHLYVGHLHGRATPQLENLQRSLNAVIPTEISDNILGVLWSKLTYTCLGYYGSLADASLVTTCADPAARRNLAEFFSEVVAVGAAAGARFIALAEYNPLDFHPSLPLERRIAAINAFAALWKADDRKGPLRQIQNGFKTEVDFTLGCVVSEGQKRGIATPLSKRVLTMVRELEAGKRSLGLENYRALRTP